MWAVKGSPYCYSHSTRGVKKIRTIHKESSLKIVQTAAKYKEIQADPQLSTLGPIQTLLVGRLMQLMERLEENDSPERMKRITDAWNNLKRSAPGLFRFVRDDKDAVRAYNEIENEINAAFHDYEAWRQVINLSDQLRKLGESRMKILKDMKALMSADEVFEMAGMLLAAVANIIDDPTKLEAIATEFASILGEDFARGPDERGTEIIDIGPSGVDRGQVLHSGDVERSDTSGEDVSPAIPERRAGRGVSD
jgi:hypothetical protein